MAEYKDGEIVNSFNDSGDEVEGDFDLPDDIDEIEGTDWSTMGGPGSVFWFRWRDIMGSSNPTSGRYTPTTNLFGFRVFDRRLDIVFDANSSHLTRIIHSRRITSNAAGSMTVNLGAHKAAFPVVTPVHNGRAEMMAVPQIEWEVNGSTGTLRWKAVEEVRRSKFPVFSRVRFPSHGYQVDIIAFA